MGRALVLNASHQPLAVVTARRAVVLVLKDKAEVVVSNGMIFRSERYEIEA
ncbi:MAG TPA: HNH endonuclease, partial [Actinomycetota bacterium]|nr:HNH endonuclease [Actinomycetota bacterium]